MRGRFSVSSAPWGIVNRVVYKFYRFYFFERVPPWVKSDYDLAGKRPKIYMTDTGLMTYLYACRSYRSVVELAERLTYTFNKVYTKLG